MGDGGGTASRRDGTPTRLRCAECQAPICPAGWPALPGARSPGCRPSGRRKPGLAGWCRRRGCRRRPRAGRTPVHGRRGRRAGARPRRGAGARVAVGTSDLATGQLAAGGPSQRRHLRDARPHPRPAIGTGGLPPAPGRPPPGLHRHGAAGGAVGDRLPHLGTALGADRARARGARRRVGMGGAGTRRRQGPRRAVLRRPYREQDPTFTALAADGSELGRIRTGPPGS